MLTTNILKLNPMLKILQKVLNQSTKKTMTKHLKTKNKQVLAILCLFLVKNSQKNSQDGAINAVHVYLSTITKITSKSPIKMS